MKISKEILKITVLGGLLLVVQVFAFTEPSVAPPGDNVPAPLNVGNKWQDKAQGLGLAGLSTQGLTALATNAAYNVGVGTISPAQKLHVVGGKAQADDFCLNSDPSTCLSAFYGPKLCIIAEEASVSEGGTEIIIDDYQPAPNFWTPNHCVKFIQSIMKERYALGCLQSDGRVSYSVDVFDRIQFGKAGPPYKSAGIPSPNCGW